VPTYKVALLLFRSLGDLGEPAASELDRLALHRIEALHRRCYCEELLHSVSDVHVYWVSSMLNRQS